MTPARAASEPVFTRRQAIGIWSIVALVFIAQQVMGELSRGRPVSLQWDVAHELLYWTLWAAASLAIARLARRHWTEPAPGARLWWMHGAASVAIGVGQVTATYLIQDAVLVVIGRVPAGEFAHWFASNGRAIAPLAVTGIVYYWIILGVYYAVAYQRLYRIERAEAAAAQLAALRAQLRPHFLFNTLNSIAVLVRERPAAAEAMLGRLGELLRRVLRQDASHEVPLAEEVATVTTYLEIQRMRFEDRLRASIAVDESVRDALVPEMILQPLVENAVQYAVEPRVGGGAVTVTARRAGDRLLLRVEDDGPGFGTRGPDDGVGLANTRTRLERLYGAEQAFTLANGAAGGAVAEISIPFRQAGAT